MGEPVKIVDLAQTMIRLTGRSEHEIRIEFTGLRPGEKLLEELLADADTTLATGVASLRLAKLRDEDFAVGPAGAGVLDWLHRIAGRATEADTSDIKVRRGLCDVVPEYRSR